MKKQFLIAYVIYYFKKYSKYFSAENKNFIYKAQLKLGFIHSVASKEQLIVLKICN